MASSARRHRPRTLAVERRSETVVPLAYVRATWTWSSRSARRSPRRSGRSPIGARRLRPTANPVYLRADNGVTSSPNGHVPSAGPRATGRTTPGRARVYCTNACRQRAYRWRRQAIVPSDGGASATAAPVRARTRDGLHALRSDGDLVAGRRDSTGRQVTACGAFARSARDRPSFAWHTDFIAGGPSSCRTCAAVLHVEPTPVADDARTGAAVRRERRGAR